MRSPYPQRLRLFRHKSAGDVERFIGGNHVRLLTDSVEAIYTMLQAIEDAHRAIWIEMYWFAGDRVGGLFFDALERAARRGVEVRLLYDALGSFGTEGACFDRLRAAGAAVLEFHPLNPFQRRTRVGRLTVRNHRKLVLVDFRLAFVGGLNFAEEWMPVDEGGKGWRDDLLEVRGPVVQPLSSSFVSSWCEQSDERPAVPAASEPTEGGVLAAVLAQARYRERRSASDAYLSRLRQAQEQILIANAYFVPNGRIRRALIAAVRRGVDVQIMVPARSDIEAVRHASRAVWGGLLRHGARIFEWQPSMLHCKTAVIDTRWVTTGSFNLDYVSLMNNRELNVSVLDRGFARQVAASFQRDLQHCYEVDAHDFRFRSLGERLAERVLYWFRAWL